MAETRSQSFDNQLANRQADSMREKPATLERLFTERDLIEAGFGSRTTLARQRMNGNGIPFVYIGSAVRYRQSDVEAWLDANRNRFALQTRPPHKRGGRPKRS